MRLVNHSNTCSEVEINEGLGGGSQHSGMIGVCLPPGLALRHSLVFLLPGLVVVFHPIVLPSSNIDGSVDVGALVDVSIVGTAMRTDIDILE